MSVGTVDCNSTDDGSTLENVVKVEGFVWIVVILRDAVKAADRAPDKPSWDECQTLSALEAEGGVLALGIFIVTLDFANE